jgi:hypothetical protein
MDFDFSIGPPELARIYNEIFGRLGLARAGSLAIAARIELCRLKGKQRPCV